MAGLADAWAIAVGRTDSSGRSNLAAFGVEPEERPLFTAADRFLDLPRNNSHHLFALDTEFALAGRDAGGRRHSDGVGAGIRDGTARQLFRVVVPAGDHCREHFVFARDRVRDRGDMRLAARRHDGFVLCGKDSADVQQRLYARGVALLVSGQRVRLFRDRVSGEPSGAVVAAEGNRTRGEAGRTGRAAGVHRGHHPLDAGRADHDRHGWADRVVEPDGRRDSGTSLRGYSRKEAFGIERTVLAAGIARRQRQTVAAARGRVPHAGWAAAVSGDQYFAIAFAR